ncbi:MAG: SusD/RagB family nutrient-binding outer membrane lipoprotein [Bacteroides sp.]|nr:SusD/RagB family nutrient-binding outer membrane lipoprotein [Bacteroides sp.]
MKIKKFYKYLLMGAICLSTVACEDLDTMNEDPNNPTDVPSNMLMSGAEKWIMDNIYDNWFSGRQCLLYAQYWAQRNYTEEDRYQIRESTNNSYFNYLYMGIANLEKVIEMNTDEATASTNSAYGANCNQIAAVKILKVWLMQIITDTWGNVPYSEVAKLESEGVLYCKYDDQADIYAGMLAELDEAIAMIDEDEEAFTSGDVIYDGDATKWKKFGNSLKCRLAIHLSKVDSNWKTYISQAVASGVFESNDDAAVFQYVTSGSDYCMFYSGFYVSGRNDFTITKQFCDLLQGDADTLNGKSHPWEGTVDPRLSMYTNDNGGAYIGFPYGVSSAISTAARTGTPNWYNGQPVFLEPDFAVPMMTYAELKFILSEYNDFSEADYREGVEASIEFWADASGTSVSDADLTAYIDAVSQNVNAEAVAVQKYIDLFINGTEAWTEIRRTGYPEQLVRPGEITGVVNDAEITFEPLSEVNDDIISRVKYPTNESTLNGSNWEDAVSRLTDGTNNYYTKMYWDVRTSAYDHPANK